VVRLMAQPETLSGPHAGILIEDLSPQAFALAAISALGAVLTELSQFVRDTPHHDLTITEVVENTADALQCVIHATGSDDEDVGQLLSAISIYLDGWA